jgi:hypothetical protein
MGRTRSRHRFYCRTSESYRRYHAPELLKVLGEARKEVCLQPAPLNSPDYAALRKITGAIDDFAELVTGNREHFWLKPHRTMSGPNDDRP